MNDAYQDICASICQMLKSIAGNDDETPIRENSPLLGPKGMLDSLTSVRLIAGVERQYGIDIMNSDLGLACLETPGTLAAFVAERMDKDIR